MDILNSASKLVFIILALTASIAFIYEVIAGRITLSADDFMKLVLMAFTFYFAYKGSDPVVPTTTRQEDKEPFAGK